MRRQTTITSSGVAQNYALFGEILWKPYNRYWDNRFLYHLQQLFLSDLPDRMTENDKYLLRIMSAAAIKAITRKWLQSDPPTTSNWLEIMKEIHQMERLTFLLRLKRDLYYARWEKWMAFLTNEEGRSWSLFALFFPPYFYFIILPIYLFDVKYNRQILFKRYILFVIFR